MRDRKTFLPSINIWPDTKEAHSLSLFHKEKKIFIKLIYIVKALCSSSLLFWLLANEIEAFAAALRSLRVLATSWGLAVQARRGLSLWEEWPVIKNDRVGRWGLNPSAGKVLHPQNIHQICFLSCHDCITWNYCALGMFSVIVPRMYEIKVF